ncbi:MAG: hypothetical protein AAB443_04905 [Patescibacteria group bacterium]
MFRNAALTFVLLLVTFVVVSFGIFKLFSSGFFPFNKVIQKPLSKESMSSKETYTHLGKTLEGYPYTSYKKVSEQKKKVLESEVKKTASGEWETVFDEYGFILSVLTPDFGLVDKSTSYEEPVTQAELRKVEQFILENSRYFGIESTSSVKFNKALIPYSTVSHIASQNKESVVFEKGAVISSPDFGKHGAIFIERSMRELGQGAELDIYGHYWPEVSLPENPLISEEQLRNEFVGKDYRHIEYILCDSSVDSSKDQVRFGVPSGCSEEKELIQKIADKDLEVLLKTFFYENLAKNQVEVRLAYEVKLTVSPGFVKVIDAVTGELLSSRQL